MIRTSAIPQHHQNFKFHNSGKKLEALYKKMKEGSSHSLCEYQGAFQRGETIMGRIFSGTDAVENWEHNVDAQYNNSEDLNEHTILYITEYNIKFGVPVKLTRLTRVKLNYARFCCL